MKDNHNKLHNKEEQNKDQPGQMVVVINNKHHNNHKSQPNQQFADTQMYHMLQEVYHKETLRDALPVTSSAFKWWSDI